MSDAPAAGRFNGREHVLPLRVYYEDTDFTGLVYHASYVRFFERGRSDFLRLAGVDHVTMARLDTAFAVLRLEIEFKAAARIDDALTVRTAFQAVRGARLRIAQRILRGATPIAQAAVEIACIDKAGRAKRPPKMLTEALADFLLPCAAEKVAAKRTEGASAR